MRQYLMPGMLLAGVLLCGCNPVKKYMMNQVANELASSTKSFHSDNDPELIRESLPFALKMIEAILVKTPRHRGLLKQACSGFTEYAYGFLQQDADEIEDDDLDRATTLRMRARNMYLRARDYGLRGLETTHKNFGVLLRSNAENAVRKLGRRDVELAYWTAAAWGMAISLGKDDPHLIAEQPIVEALLDRVMELDETFDDGALHEAMISYEMARKGAAGKPEARARRHFERALELSRGTRAAPYVNFAEAVSLQNQNRKEFESLLRKALTVDVNKRPEYRVENLILQKRARWLLSRVDDLFVE